MQFTPENKSDIQKYYVGTYVKFRAHVVDKSLHPDTLFYIESVDSSKVYGKCEDGNQFVIWLSEKFPFEVDYVLPHKSFFQHGDHAVLLERIPAQQYFRGVSGENTRMTYLNEKGVVKTQSITFNSLKEYVTKQAFLSLQGAIGAATVSCVLSPRMQYHRPTKTIYIDHCPVARVDQQHHLIKMLKPIFREEVEEMLRNDGDTMFKIIEEKQPAAKQVAEEMQW